MGNKAHHGKKQAHHGKFHQNSVFVRLILYKYQGEAIPIFIEGPASIESPLVMIQWLRTLSDPFATMQVRLKGRHTIPGPYQGEKYASLIDNGDYWSLDVIKNGYAYGLGFGIIDHVSLSINGPAGATHVTLACRSMGYALADTPIYFNPYDPDLARSNAAGVFMYSLLDDISGSPSELVTGLIRGFLGRRGEGILGSTYEIPASTRHRSPTGREQVYWIDLVDMETRVQRNLRGQVFPGAIAALTAESAPMVWDFIREWRNPVMNEMWLDESVKPSSYTIRKQPQVRQVAQLVVREKPFVNAIDGENSPWFKLTKRMIEGWSLKGLSLAKGHHRANMVELSGDLLPAMGNDAKYLYPPRTDFDDARRYGLKRIVETTRYFDEVKDSGFTSEAQEWLQLITSWHALNHEYWNGTLSIAEIRPDIKVGQRVFVRGPVGHDWPGGEKGGEIMSFYVEGVQHTYVPGPEPMAETQIQVSRGFQEGKRVATVKARFGQFSGLNTTATGKASANDYNTLDDPDIEEDGGVHDDS